MHTNKTVIGFDDNTLSFRERRLCFIDQQRRHDVLDEADNTGGRMEDKTPIEALKSNTEKLADDISQIKIGWGKWINHFFSSKRAIDKDMHEGIMQAAEKRINEESSLAVGKIGGLFLRGKRRLYLASKEKIADQIRNDLKTYLESQQRESSEREGRFSRLSEMLRKKKGPILIKSEAERQKLIDSLTRVSVQRSGNMPEDGTIPKEWEEALEAEEMVKQQLLKLGILDPTTIGKYLDQNAQGNNILQKLINKAPQLSSEPELRKCLITTLKDLRRGNSRHYRLQRSMETDANIGTLEDRLKRLQQDSNIIGRTISVKIGGAPKEDLFVAHRGDGFLVLQGVENSRKKYFILDTGTGEITYKDTSRVFHDYQLKESTLSISS